MAHELYSRGSARKSLIDTVAFRILSQCATISSYILLVRGMTEEQFGVLSLLYSFIPVIGTVLSLGLEQVLQRYQPEYLRAGNKIAAAWLVRFVASTRFIANLVMMAVILLAWDYIAPVFKVADYRWLFAGFIFLILLHFQARVLQFALASHMMHRFSMGSMSLLAIVKLVIYAVLFWRDALTIEAAIIADTIAYASAYLCMRIVYVRRCLTEDAKGSFKPEPAERKRLIRYGFYNNFNDAGVLLLYSTLDNFFIAAFLDTLSVGIYTFFSRLREMLINALPVKLFENVIRPMFFSIPREQADHSVPRYFTFLLNMNLLMQWPALAFVTAYHAEIVQVVFGGKFIEESWLLPLFMFFGLLNAVADPASIVAQYEEKVAMLLASKLFAIYNVAAMFVAVPLLGLYGAVLASGTAQLFKNLFIWWHVRRRAVWLNALPSTLANVSIWGLCVAACYAIRFLLDGPAVLNLVIGVAVFGMTMLLYLRSPALASSDRELLQAVLPERLGGLARALGLRPAAEGRGVRNP